MKHTILDVCLVLALLIMATATLPSRQAGIAAYNKDLGGTSQDLAFQPVTLDSNGYEITRLGPNSRYAVYKVTDDSANDHHLCYTVIDTVGSLGPSISCVR